MHKLRTGTDWANVVYGKGKHTLLQRRIGRELAKLRRMKKEGSEDYSVQRRRVESLLGEYISAYSESLQDMTDEQLEGEVQRNERNRRRLMRIGKNQQEPIAVGMAFEALALGGRAEDEQRRRRRERRGDFEPKLVEISAGNRELLTQNGGERIKELLELGGDRKYRKELWRFGVPTQMATGIFTDGKTTMMANNYTALLVHDPAGEPLTRPVWISGSDAEELAAGEREGSDVEMYESRKKPDIVMGKVFGALKVDGSPAGKLQAGRVMEVLKGRKSDNMVVLEVRDGELWAMPGKGPSRDVPGESDVSVYRDKAVKVGAVSGVTTGRTMVMRKDRLGTMLSGVPQGAMDVRWVEQGHGKALYVEGEGEDGKQYQAISMAVPKAKVVDIS